MIAGVLGHFGEHKNVGELGCFVELVIGISKPEYKR
jgi:hypothetical protein